jgi:membrane protease YdiL (CAAX protease family)
MPVNRFLAPGIEIVFPFLAVNLFAIPWDFALILIVLGVLVPWRGAVRVRRLLALPALTSAQRISLYASTIMFQWSLVAVIYWRSASRSLSPGELGLVVSDVWRTLTIAIVFTALLCLNQWTGLRKIASLPTEQRGFLFQFTQKIMPQSSTEALAFVALALTAGLSEEFIYRGFIIALLGRVLGDSLPALFLITAVSSALFSLAHLYQGRRSLLTTFVVGALFASVRLWTGSLVPAMMGHAGVDLVAGLAAPRMLRARGASSVTGGPPAGAGSIT